MQAAAQVPWSGVALRGTGYPAAELRSSFRGLGPSPHPGLHTHSPSHTQASTHTGLHTQRPSHTQAPAAPAWAPSCRLQSRYDGHNRHSGINIHDGQKRHGGISRRPQPAVDSIMNHKEGLRIWGEEGLGDGGGDGSRHWGEEGLRREGKERLRHGEEEGLRSVGREGLRHVEEEGLRRDVTEGWRSGAEEELRQGERGPLRSGLFQRGSGDEALLPALEQRRRAVACALDHALQRQRVSPTYARELLRQLPPLLDTLLLHAVRLKAASPQLALQPFSGRAAAAVAQSGLAQTARRLQRLGLSPGRTAQLLLAALRVAAAGAQEGAGSLASVGEKQGGPWGPVSGGGQGRVAAVAPLEALGDAMGRLGQNMAWLHSVSKKGLRRPGQLAKLAEADNWALLRVPLAELQARQLALWGWLRFTGGMGEMWVHQVHCQPGLLTQPQAELTARLALLRGLAAQRLTLGPLRDASRAQLQQWPQEDPAEGASSDTLDTARGLEDVGDAQHGLEAEQDPEEDTPGRGAGQEGYSWHGVGGYRESVEEGKGRASLPSDHPTVSGTASRPEAGNGWHALGRLSGEKRDLERASEERAGAAAASTGGPPSPAPAACTPYEGGAQDSESPHALRVPPGRVGAPPISSSSLGLGAVLPSADDDTPGGFPPPTDASLALEGLLGGVPPLSNGEAALVRRMVQKAPALLSSSVPLGDLQAKVAFLGGTLGVPAGHVGRVCVAHPRVLLAHLRAPPGTQAGAQAGSEEVAGSPLPSKAGAARGYTQGVPAPGRAGPTASAGAGLLRGCACWHALLLYLQRQGLSTEDVAAMVQRHPLLLTLDLGASVCPKVAFLRASGMSAGGARAVLLQAPHLLSYSLEGRVRPLVALLREQAGVGPEALGALLCMHPDLLSSHSRLPRVLGFFRDEVGLTPRELGLMLASFPQLLGYSLRGLEEKWGFYVEQWGGDPQPLVEFPRFFSYSLESRIQRRAAVLRKEGLQSAFSLRRMLECSDEAFSSRVESTLADKNVMV